MGFHFLSAPADWISLTPAARCGMFYASDLVGDTVTYRLNWSGQPVSDPFTYPDGTALVDTTTTVGQQAWTNRFPSNGTWTITSNTLRWATIGAFPYGLIFFDGASADMDVSVDCRITTGRVGLNIRHADILGFGPFVYLQPGQKVQARAVVSGNDSLLATGSTTTATADTWYTLRVVVVGTTYDVYVDGVLEMTFTHAGNSTTKTSALGVTGSTGGSSDATGPQFRNFSRAGVNHGATSYTVTNYTGDTVASGALTGAETSLSFADSALVQASGGTFGSYDLYLFGADRGSGYYDTYGDAHFLRIGDDPAFPGKVDASVPQYGTEWEVRARCQMGPGATRLTLDITGDDVESLNELAIWEADYLVDNYLAYETPNRPRVIIGHFRYFIAGLESRVTDLVTLLSAHGVTHFEPRNEPGGTAAHLYVAEQAAFYGAVKAGNPNAVVLGPNPVGYAAGYNYDWISTFLANGGGDYCDEFSTHGYVDTSAIDLTMSNLQGFLNLVEPYGFTPDKLWQTEGGQYGVLFGSYRPHAYIMQMLSQELVGIEWQRNVPWYDLEHGFWDFASFWLTPVDALPHGLTPRTFVSEIGDRVLKERFDFGGADDLIYLGGSWVGDDGSRTIAIAADNSWQDPVRFQVAGASSMTAVDLFGNTFTLPVEDGILSVPADQDIVYVRVPAGVMCTFRPRTAGDAITVSSVDAPAGANNVSHLTDGILQDSWYTMDTEPVGTLLPYNSLAEVFPHEIVLNFASATVGRVLIMPLTAGWYWSAITDMTIDVYDGTWHQVYAQTSASGCSFRAYSRYMLCRWHECWEPPKVFDAVFDPIAGATKARITINGVSAGTFDTTGAFDAWWEEYGPVPHEWFAIRDVSISGTVDEWTPPPPTRDRFLLQFTAG